MLLLNLPRKLNAISVMEGYAIKNAMITSPIGGNYVSQSAMQLLKSEAHPKFHLSYEIAAKDELKAGQTGWIITFVSSVFHQGCLVPTFHLKKNLPNVTQSWRSYQESRLVQDWIRNVLQVSNDESVHSRGFNQGFNFAFKISA